MDWKTKGFIAGFVGKRLDINKDEISKFSIDGKEVHKDENNQVKDEFQRYVLHTLMRN